MLSHLLLTLPMLLCLAALLLRCAAAWGASPNLFRRFPSLWGEPQRTEEERCPEQRRIFLTALAIRLLVLFAAVACVMLQARESISFQECFQRLELWDVRHYINLAGQGYSGYQEDGQHLFLVFFPCYVWLVRLLSWVLPNTARAGALLSTLCYAWGCCWVYKTGVECSGKKTAEDAVLFLSLFPYSFFFGTVMTEGLFLLTTSAACYCALRHKWAAYAVWGCLSAMTRMTGFLVLVPAAVELLKTVQPLRPPAGQSLRAAWKALDRKIPLLLCPLLGTLSYLLLNFIVDGDAFAFVTHQKHWYQGPMWISKVVVTLWNYLVKNFGNTLGWAIWLPELLLLPAFFLLLAAGIRNRKLPASLLAYGFCYLIANYSLSWLISGGRYLSCGFVFFLFLAALTENRPTLRRLLLAGEAVFLGVMLSAYVSGAQIM